jgi:RNA polymerase sigma-70 factor (ECF subfamily)
MNSLISKTQPVTRVDWTDATDEQLLAEYVATNDRDAFARLVKRYERELYSYLRRYLGDAVMAEDAFQATFLQVHLKCRQFEAGRKVRPWLYTIATNQAIDGQRRNKRHRMVSLDRRSTNVDADDLGSLLELLVSKENGPVSSLESEERREWIQAAIVGLPDTLRSAVTLIYYQGLKYREAADVLGVPVGTVKSRLHAAILKLTEAWNGDQASSDKHGVRTK